jgi:heat-inducible transcriptional repressor
MVLVLVGGEIRQQIFSLDEIISQQKLSSLAAELNAHCQNCTLAQLEKLDLDLDDVGNIVLGVIKDQMRLSERLVIGEIYMDGLTNVLAEPEFADTEQARSALSIFEERNKLDDLLSRSFLGDEIGGVQVLIGGEGTWEELRQCSLILSHYGIQDQLTGTLGILGPMRMPYGQIISTVRFMANLLSELVAENWIE